MSNKKETAWLLLAWMIASIVLVSTIIGILLFVPGINNTGYYIPVKDRRSTWSTIGFNLLDKVLR